MVIVDPENIGCGRKVDASTLGALIAHMEALRPNCQLGGDFAALTHPLRISDAIQICSIDRTTRFCEDDDVFVRASLNHAMNDIVVGYAVPSAVSLSIGFTPTDVEKLGHFRLMDFLARESARASTAVAKMHSFYDNATNLTVSVHGWATQRVSSPIGRGSIYISKPIGALKAVYLREIGHAEVNFSAATEIITASALPMASVLADLSLCASDVSGFGLVHAADQLLVRHNLRGELNLSQVPLVSKAVTGIAVDCLLKAAITSAER
jgi:hypothetical protein